MHELALAMPHVTVEYGTGDNPVYQVGRKSFIFFRNPRPDAVDPNTGDRYADVIRELAELIQDAWLSRASARRAAAWLKAHPLT